jgi:hypothetical protein
VKSEKRKVKSEGDGESTNRRGDEARWDEMKSAKSGGNNRKITAICGQNHSAFGIQHSPAVGGRGADLS